MRCCRRPGSTPRRGSRSRRSRRPSRPELPRSSGCSRKPRARPPRPRASGSRRSGRDPPHKRACSSPLQPGIFLVAPGVSLAEHSWSSPWSGTTVGPHGSTACRSAEAGRRPPGRLRRGCDPGGRQMALCRDALGCAEQLVRRRNRASRNTQCRSGFRAARRRRRVLRDRAARACRYAACCCRMPPQRWTTTLPQRCWRSWTTTSARTISTPSSRSRRATSGCSRISACPRRCLAVILDESDLYADEQLGPDRAGDGLRRRTVGGARSSRPVSRRRPRPGRAGGRGCGRTPRRPDRRGHPGRRRHRIGAGGQRPRGNG